MSEYCTWWGRDSLHSSTWAFDHFAEIERRTLPHMPKRFLVECDALAKETGISQRDSRAVNLFIERFHGNGVAARGKASAGGKILHACMLNYMRDVRLQDAAVVTVFMPEGYHKWIGHGYAGFLGAATAMNEKGLVVGKMGSGGEGDRSYVSTAFLLRDLMERAATVDEALEILCHTSRRCDYNYVLSDKTRAMAAVRCDGEQMTILRPGQQQPQMAMVPGDTLLVTSPLQVEALRKRLLEHYGKVDVPVLVEVIKRSLAMENSLQNTIFSPEKLDLWVADADRFTPACDEPYTHVNLPTLIEFYVGHVAPTRQ